MTMTECFTIEQATELAAAGFVLTGPAWMPSRNDRFVKRNDRGVSVTIIDHRTERGTDGWRVGLSTFVDGSCGEYCDWFPALADAVERAGKYGN
jgi:hypothetical protein